MPADDTCRRARELVSLRLDDELSEFEHAQLDAHLGVCGDCLRFSDHVARLTRELRDAAPELLSRPIVVSGSRRLLRYPARAVVGVAVVAAGLAIVIGPLNALEGSRPRPDPATLLPRDARQQQFARSQVLREQPAFREPAPPSGPASSRH